MIRYLTDEISDVLEAIGDFGGYMYECQLEDQLSGEISLVSGEIVLDNDYVDEYHYTNYGIAKIQHEEIPRSAAEQHLLHDAFEALSRHIVGDFTVVEDTEHSNLAAIVCNKHPRTPVVVGPVISLLHRKQPTCVDCYNDEQRRLRNMSNAHSQTSPVRNPLFDDPFELRLRAAAAQRLCMLSGVILLGESYKDLFDKQGQFNPITTRGRLFNLNKN